MSRAVRITVGAVVAGTLAFVALVAGVMSASAGGAGGGFFDDLGTEYLDTYGTAEVLDVDDEWDWPTVDVRWTTPDGEVVVTAVDWEWTDVLPEVGDDVEVVYDSADPEWAYAADDPYVESAPAVTDGADEDLGADPGAPAEDAVGRVAGWVSLGALLGLVVTVVVTVVAAVRAPAPVERGAAGPGPYGPPGFVGAQYPSPPHLTPHLTPHPGPQPQRPAEPGPTHPRPGWAVPPSGPGDGWSAP